MALMYPTFSELGKKNSEPAGWLYGVNYVKKDVGASRKHDSASYKWVAV